MTFATVLPSSLKKAQNDAQHRRGDGVDLVGGDDGRHQHAQDVDHDDVGVGKSQAVESHVDQRNRQQDDDALCRIRNAELRQFLPFLQYFSWYDRLPYIPCR